MNILDYYKSQQKDTNWYINFQSFGNKYNGKLYDFIDTNFRKLTSFFSQLDAFKSKDGLKRSQWSTMGCGQEEDKHRVVNLKNAGLIYYDGESFHITKKGIEVLELNSSENLNKREKWLILLILLMDYQTDNCKMSILKTAINFSETLSNYNITRKALIGMLNQASKIKTKNELFTQDIFWLLTFYKDNDFISLYSASSEEEKKQLHDYVILCSENKESNDLIARKCVSGGRYSVSTFKEDVNITLCVLVIAAIQDKDWNGFLNVICKYYSIDEDKIKNYINRHLDLYNSIYDRTFGLLISKQED